jgi:DNA-binding protein Fis
LFERLRLWAYRERRQPYLSEEMFHAAVRNHALVLNSEFHPPLPHSEVRSTAKSVARWTWRRMSAEGFRAYQSALGKRSGQVRKMKAEELRARIVEAVEQCPDLAQADIAAMMGVNQATVSRHLRDYARTISDKGSDSDRGSV